MQDYGYSVMLHLRTKDGIVGPLETRGLLKAIGRAFGKPSSSIDSSGESPLHGGFSSCGAAVALRLHRRLRNAR